MNRGPLSSTIPDDHPQKAEIEAICHRLLGRLGAGWAITVEAADRTDWAVALLRRRVGRHPHQRNWEAPPRAQQPGAIEAWLREAARQIRQESDVRFGMVPLGKLSDETVAQLVDLVGLYGGQLHPDGWITLPDDKAWPAFLNRTDSLGVTLAASVR